VTVASTNDEWTPAGISVGAGDLLLVKTPGNITIGQYSSAVDAGGMNGRRDQQGAGLLQYKIGVGAAHSVGTTLFVIPSDPGELKFRVLDSRYDDNSGACEVDVIVVPKSVIPRAVHSQP
jgi:hypothetical protein